MSNCFSGNLELDSPRCRHLIKGVFGTDLCLKLEQLYSEQFEIRPFYELPTNRKPEVHYNPRPARLAQILISEAKCSDFSLIEKAFSFCFLEESVIFDHLSGSGRYKEDLIFAVALLDELRHLHMHPSLLPKKVEAIIQFIQSQLGKGTFDESARIREMIVSALERLPGLKNRGQREILRFF